jgi:phage regulator Rha-like protein
MPFFNFNEYFRTWLTSNVDAARVVAKRHQDLLNEISDKVNDIKDRFKLKSIEYSEDWSVSQFYTCLRTLLMYVDKWHERLLSLQGISWI